MQYTPPSIGQQRLPSLSRPSNLCIHDVDCTGSLWQAMRVLTTSNPSKFNQSLIRKADKKCACQSALDDEHLLLTNLRIPQVLSGLKPAMTIYPSGIKTRSTSRSVCWGLTLKSKVWGNNTKSMVLLAIGNCCVSHNKLPWVSLAFSANGIRELRNKSACKKPNCSALKPKISLTRSSKRVCSCANR